MVTFSGWWMVLFLLATSCTGFVQQKQAATSERARTIKIKDVYRIRSRPLTFGQSDAQVEDPGIRLNKCFKAFASRRESDRFIEAGRVTVNGKVAGPGTRVSPGDAVALDGRRVAWERLAVVAAADGAAAAAAPGGDGQGLLGETKEKQPSKLQQFHYIKYNKPRGITSTTDLRQKDNIIKALGPGLREACGGDRVYPVGRLDKDTSGLILLTSDGRLPDRLGRQQAKKDKVYLVTVERPIDDSALKQMAQGVIITTKVQRDRGDREVAAPTRPCRVARLGARRYRVVLQEGRNRQVRKMAEAVGHRVVLLHRSAYAGIRLGDLAEGHWQPLTEEELALIL